MTDGIESSSLMQKKRFVTPEKAGVRFLERKQSVLDSGLHRNDEKGSLAKELSWQV